MALVLAGEHEGSSEDKEAWGTASSFSLTFGLAVGSFFALALGPVAEPSRHPSELDL